MRKYFEITTSDKNIIKRELIRQIVYLTAETLMVGKNALPMEAMGVLDLKMMLPKVKRLDPQLITEGARADYQKIEWFQIEQTMKKEQVAMYVTDEAKVRGQMDIQMRYSLNAAANGLAWSKDTDIFTVLQAGSAGTDAASGLWSDPTTDIATDLAMTIGNIFANTVITDADIPNIQLFYPAKLWGHLAKPIQVGQIQQTIRNWAQTNFQINFWPTRQLTTSAMIVLKSPETATHITYSGGDIPLVEDWREPGVGQKYLITQLFKTFIMPEAEGGSTNNRIRMISGVCT